MIPALFLRHADFAISDEIATNLAHEARIEVVQVDGRLPIWPLHRVRLACAAATEAEERDVLRALHALEDGATHLAVQPLLAGLCVVVVNMDKVACELVRLGIGTHVAKLEASCEALRLSLLCSAQVHVALAKQAVPSACFL